MWMLLLGLIGAGAAAGGGSSSSEPERNANDVLPGLDFVEEPVGDDEENIFDDLRDDGDTMDHGDDHMGDDIMAGDDTMDHGDDHMGDDIMAGDDTMDHGDDHMGDDIMAGDDHMHHEPIVLPITEAEVEAFVAAVRSAPEIHSHDHAASKASEHMAAMDLVPRDEATHIAIGHGNWDDAWNWHNGEVPGEGANVLIPESVHMIYDHVSEDELFTVRVDGHLEFATDADSKLVLDTLVISPSGELTIGTEADPVATNVNVDIVFANNGPIDTDWDPMLLSRGMISHGQVEIHGAEKDSHEKVMEDPMKGETWIDFSGTPEGWQVGDTIVIAGTRYEGHTDPENYQLPEDEVRIITDIQDGRVFFEEPLVFDHDTPRDDLKTSVANYTRNISFETENAATAEIYERGHVMFMHNDDVDVRYAEFHELGRTDKSEPGQDAGDLTDAAFDSNVKGRYSFHLHRAGTDDLDNPAVVTGNAVYGSPGWGFVHHDSNAVLDNNATYNTFGAGYVAESGNETGAWTDNIAIFAKGNSFLQPKLGNSIEDVANFDLGKTGDGFWFQGRMVESTDNIAASVNNGFVYFHRGPLGEDTMPFINADSAEYGDFLYGAEYLVADQHPILSFSGNESFASNMGLYVVKGNANQNHDVHSVIDDFTAWSVNNGLGLEYTAHYTLQDLDLVSQDDPHSIPEYSVGIQTGPNVFDVTFVDSNIEGFRIGAYLGKATVPENIDPALHEYTFVNPTFTNVDQEFANFDPTLDTVLKSSEVPELTPDILLDAPLSYSTSGNGTLEISGTKSDSLGTTDFPSGIDTYKLFPQQVAHELEEEGYYTTTAGQNYFMLDVYFSDRLSGDIYFEKHPVLLDNTVAPGFGQFEEATFNGILDLGGEDDPTMDSAELWAALTDGQVVLSESSTAADDPEEELIDAI